jgi:hypothetical protein
MAIADSFSFAVEAPLHRLQEAVGDVDWQGAMVRVHLALIRKAVRLGSPRAKLRDLNGLKCAHGGSFCYPYEVATAALIRNYSALGPVGTSNG